MSIHGALSPHLSTRNHVTAGDGYAIGDAATEQLVEAMTAFTPPASGRTTLPPAANRQHP